MSRYPFSQEEIAQFFEGSLPELEYTEILNWFSSLTKDEQLKFMDLHFNTLEKTGNVQSLDNPIGFKKIETRILTQKHRQVKTLHAVLKIAAATLPFIVGYLLFMQPGKINKVSRAHHTVAYIRNIQISNSLNTIKYIQLPDSSSVDLYPGATLNYPVALAGKKREIILTGKAFFKVKHDRQRPFIVQSGAITTVVLGTSFWIDAQKHTGLITVKVKTGKVGVLHDKDPVLFLLPSEKAVFSISSGVLAKVKPTIVKKPMFAPTELPTAMVFNETPLKQVVKILAENFKVNIDIDAAVNTELPISLTTRNKTIKEVLHEISSQIPLDYEIKDNNIKIKKQE